MIRKDEKLDLRDAVAYGKDAALATVYYGDASWHDGPGWYYVINDYPDEGSCGAWASPMEAMAHARECGLKVDVVHGNRDLARTAKEVTYDAEIHPLMTQILDICQRNQINMVAGFSLGIDQANGTPICCTSAISADQDDADGIRRVASIVHFLTGDA